MKKIINVLRQLVICLSFRKTYPSIYLWGYWECFVNKDCETEYNQWKTLKNYIFNHKTM